MRLFVSLSLLLMAVPLVRADVASGPKEGDKAAALKVYAVTGESKEKEVDYIDLRKEKPTVYVFVPADKFTRPMFQFIKKLDEGVGDAGMVVCVWLCDDVDKTKDYLPKISQYFTNAALTLFPGEKAGPKDWAINIDAHLTAVVVKDGKVVKSYSYNSVNGTDAEPVAEALKKAAKK